MPFLEKTINEHVQSKDENKTKGFVDAMLGFMGFEKSESIEQPNIKAIIFVMIIRAPAADVLNVPNAKFLAHLAHQTQKWSFIRCFKW